MPCSLQSESRLRAKGIAPVAGVDEAGRGPLAGPVVAAAVILPDGFCMPGLDDSKKLSALKRGELYRALLSTPGVVWAVAQRSAEEIDRMNILRATQDAMREAVLALKPVPQHALIDGLAVMPFPIAQSAIVGGDGLSLSIAAASIIAKVQRDLFMLEVARQYPQYAFEKHKGYGTAEHLEKLLAFGPCPVHRRSFAPVARAWAARG